MFCLIVYLVTIKAFIAILATMIITYNVHNILCLKKLPRNSNNFSPSIDSRRQRGYRETVFHLICPIFFFIIFLHYFLLKVMTFRLYWPISSKMKINNFQQKMCYSEKININTFRMMFLKK